MALFGGKSIDELVKAKVEAASAQTELKILREQIVRLEKQIDTLQTALVSKEAPIAYRDMYESTIAPPEDLEAKERLRAEKLVNGKWLEMMERPLFSDNAESFIEEMQYTLGARAGQPDITPLDPSNSES